VGSGRTTNGANGWSARNNDEFNHTGCGPSTASTSPSRRQPLPIILRPTRKASVWTIHADPNCLLAHTRGWPARRTCLCRGDGTAAAGSGRKPLIVVPNHMLGQFAAEFLALYPGANILVATGTT